MGYGNETDDIRGTGRDTDMGPDAVDGTFIVDVLLKDGDLNGKFLKFVMNDGSNVDDIVMMIDREFPGYCLKTVRLLFEEDCE